MKTRTALSIVTLILSVQFAAAGEPAVKLNTTEKKVAYAVRNLSAAFQSGNEGVIESALRLTARMKMQYPFADVTELTKLISGISQMNHSGSLRYKAYITASICANPEWFASDRRLTAGNDEQFFRTASERMQEKLLSVNTN